MADSNRTFVVAVRDGLNGRRALQRTLSLARAADGIGSVTQFLLYACDSDFLQVA